VPKKGEKGHSHQKCEGKEKRRLKKGGKKKVAKLPTRTRFKLKGGKRGHWGYSVL